MILSLRTVKDVSGSQEHFSYALDLSGMEMGFQTPAQEPIQVTGMVKNAAGMLTLEATMQTTLHLVCDRCNADFTRDKTLAVSCPLATSVEDAENDEIFVYSGEEVALDDIFIPAFVLDMETKNLCADDCKGLCAQCGHNLNQGPCDCKPPSDPRWDALKQLQLP